MAGHASTLRVVIAALIGNLLISLAKFVAFFLTASSAMLAEAFHSVADTGNQLLMLVGIRREQKPPDAKHPYGYGKESYFWSFVVALSIFSLGAAFAFYEGSHKLLAIYAHGEREVGNQLAGIVVLGVSLVIEGMSFRVAMAEFKRSAGKSGLRKAVVESRSATIITVLFEDAAAVAGLAVALVGVGLTALTRNPVWDAMATLIIGIILAVVAVFLGRMTKHLLIGQSASRADEAAIAEAVKSVEGVVGIVELRTLHMGAEFILLNLGVKFQDGLVTRELEAVIDAIEHRVKAAVPEVKRIFIEADSFKHADAAAGGPTKA